MKAKPRYKNSLIKENKVITFDFDDTLLKFSLDEDEGLIATGPNMQMVNRLKLFKSKGYKVYIVTSRIKKHEEKHPDISVKLFVQQHALPIDGIYFTDGDLKVNTLRLLGSSLHHDDDIVEIQAIKKELPNTRVVQVNY